MLTKEQAEQKVAQLTVQAESDPDARRVYDALNSTLDTFGVLMNRTYVGGVLLFADRMNGVRIHDFIDMEDPRNDQMVRMLTYFKQLQGKSMPNTDLDG